jgi:hypothetical protein
MCESAVSLPYIYIYLDMVSARYYETCAPPRGTIRLRGGDPIQPNSGTRTHAYLVTDLCVCR